MKLIFGFLLAVTSLNATADIVTKATIDITCAETNADKPRIFRIISNPEGSEILFAGQIYKSDKQLGAGTEGTKPSLQAMDDNGGFNIFVTGGDLEKGVYKRDGAQIKNGEAFAEISLFDTKNFKKYAEFKAYCTGDFLFVDAINETRNK